MTATTLPVPAFRKTKAGEWVVCGVPALVKADRDVVVRKADGTTKQVYIARVGRPFQAGATRMVYGYLTSAVSSVEPTGRDQRHSRRSCVSGGDCSSFGNGSSCGGHDCDGW